MKISQDIAITVYGPEVSKSSLTSLIDRYIIDITELEPVSRFDVVHNASSIYQFYSLTQSTNGAHWPLVVKLFDGQTATVTLWKGHNALSMLQNIKGATQPAMAKLKTLRARFWCDNPVCNLLHVSDDDVIMRDELQILKNQKTKKHNTISLTQNSTVNLNQIRHSSLWEYINILAKLSGFTLSSKLLPKNGMAKESAKSIISTLIQQGKNSNWEKELTKHYLNGNPCSIEIIKQHHSSLSTWQELILECGLHSNPNWMKELEIENFQ